MYGIATQPHEISYDMYQSPSEGTTIDAGNNCTFEEVFAFKGQKLIKDLMKKIRGLSWNLGKTIFQILIHIL
ncbi:MAG: hypothetical protein QW364_03600 [Thermoplasmatales archaeon]